MAALIASAVVTVLLVVGIYWLCNAFLRRIGMKTVGDLAPARRRLFWLAMLAALGIAALEIWAFGTHHAAVGIAGLVVFFVLPEFVLVPMRIRRSRRAAERSRARRTASNPRAT